MPNDIDPPTCPSCGSQIWVISGIEDEQAIEKILKHLGSRGIKPRPLPKATKPQKTLEYSIDYSDSHLPAFDNWL